MRTTIHFHASISLEDIENALHVAGIHLRHDGCGRVLAERVPAFVAKETPATNVVELRKSKKGKA